LNFIKEELFPFIDKNYRTEAFRIFSGHSLGGLCVFYALVTEPEMFNAYIAISSSIYWDDSALLKMAEKTITNTNKLKKSLYFAVEEGESDHIKANRNMAQLLKDNPFEGLRWKFDLMKNEGHVSIWVKSFNEGLEFVSPWNLPEDVLSGGIEAIVKHFNDLKMDISEEMLNKFALDFDSQKNFNETINVLKYIIKINPRSDETYHILGDEYRSNNQLELARQTFEAGIKIAEENSNHELKNLLEDHLKEVQELLKK